MICFFARHIVKETWILQLREWDGYDRPVYTPVLYITREEQELKAGRFINYLPPSDNNKRKLKHSIFVDDQLHISEMLLWIFSNVKGKWSIDFHEYLPITYEVYLEDEYEAVFCRLMVP